MANTSNYISAGPIVSRRQRWAVRFVRVVGWVALILGFLALAGRIIRISIEGAESVEWFRIIFLLPLGFITCGVLWLLSVRQLHQSKWLRGFALVICGVLAAVASVQLTERLYDPYTPENAAANSYPWVEFDIPDSPFRVSLPHLPERERDIEATAFGDMAIEFFAVYDGPSGYTISINDYPEGAVDLLTSGGEDFSSYMSDAALEGRPGSRVLSRKPIESSGWVGIEEEIEMPSGRLGKTEVSRPVIVFRRFYQRADRMALFMMLTERSTYEQDKSEVERNADRFLNSIRIDPSTDEGV